MSRYKLGRIKERNREKEYRISPGAGMHLLASLCVFPLQL